MPRDAFVDFYSGTSKIASEKVREQLVTGFSLLHVQLWLTVPKNAKSSASIHLQTFGTDRDSDEHHRFSTLY